MAAAPACRIHRCSAVLPHAADVTHGPNGAATASSGARAPWVPLLRAWHAYTRGPLTARLAWPPTLRGNGNDLDGKRTWHTQETPTLVQRALRLQAFGNFRPSHTCITERIPRVCRRRATRAQAQRRVQFLLSSGLDRQQTARSSLRQIGASECRGDLTRGKLPDNAGGGATGALTHRLRSRDRAHTGYTRAPPAEGSS